MELLSLLQSKRIEILALAHHYGAENIRVFGSVARREDTCDSDIDFLVVFPKGYDLFAQRLPLMAKLKELLGHPIEVIPEHELNHHLRDSILKEAREI